jgi:hypothetical protein
MAPFGVIFKMGKKEVKKKGKILILLEQSELLISRQHLIDICV